VSGRPTGCRTLWACRFLAWQLGDVRCDTAHLILAEQLGRRTPPRLILIIDVRERLPVVVAHDETVRRDFDRPRRRSGIWLQTKAAPKQQSRRRRGANGFALTPDAVIREGNRAVELAVGESPHLVSPSCVEKGRRLQSDPRSSKHQRAILWPPNRCPGSVSAPSDLPELGLSAGSTVRILSH
jgi:hypothetical protein